jgi:2,3-bisphosphoglycerate-independent phosphoglycerate mutase
MKPVVLCLLDGWGVSKSEDNNAIRAAKIPYFKYLVSHYPATVINSFPKKDSFNYGIIGSGQWTLRKKVSLAKIIASAGLKQVKIAETEKFALTTNFFNLSELPLAGEEQILVSSTATVATDYKMATAEVVKRLIGILKKDAPNFIVISLANIDNISHSGDFKKTVAAVDYIDAMLKKIVGAVLEKQGVLIVTSAHGYAEEVYNMQTDLANTGNSKNPVPFILVGKEYEGRTIGLEEAPKNDLSLLEPVGDLTNIAPTILQIMNLEIPKEMKGKSLLEV